MWHFNKNLPFVPALDQEFNRPFSKAYWSASLYLSLCEVFSCLCCPIGIVEHVRDGATLRVLLVPQFQVLTVAMSGIKVCAAECCS